MLFEAMDTREGVIEWVKTASHHPSASLAELGDPPDGRAGAAEVSGLPPRQSRRLDRRQATPRAGELRRTRRLRRSRAA